MSGPLVGLGLVDSIDDVIEIMKEYDDDGSCEIEFEEFLKIIQSMKSRKPASPENPEARVDGCAVKDFFNDFTLGKLNTKGLRFQNWVLT